MAGVLLFSVTIHNPGRHRVWFNGRETAFMAKANNEETGKKLDLPALEN